MPKLSTAPRGSRRGQFLWHGPTRALLTYLLENKGTAKSQLLAFMATIVTTGGTWPNGAQCKEGSVIILSTEDEDTIKPRLEAAGADVNRVFLLKSVREPRHPRPAGDDLEQLLLLAQEVDDLRFVSVDSDLPIVKAKAALLWPLEVMFTQVINLNLDLVVWFSKPKGNTCCARRAGRPILG